MGYEDFKDWQYAQVLAVMCLVLCVVFAVRLARKPAGHRLGSRSATVFAVLALGVAGNVWWYVVDSRPWWDARARLDESYEILDEVIAADMVSSTGYGPITVLDSHRPKTWPPNCIRGRLAGVGPARFAEPVTDLDLENLAIYFEEREFVVRRRLDGLGRAVNAARGDESYIYSFSHERNQTIASDVDVLCIEDFDPDEDCVNCVDSFLADPR